MMSRTYQTRDQFFDDIDLMCNNAMLYNEDESEVYKDAVQIKVSQLLKAFTSPPNRYRGCSNGIETRWKNDWLDRKCRGSGSTHPPSHLSGEGITFDLSLNPQNHKGLHQPQHLRLTITLYHLRRLPHLPRPHRHLSFRCYLQES